MKKELEKHSLEMKDHKKLIAQMMRKLYEDKKSMKPINQKHDNNKLEHKYTSNLVANPLFMAESNTQQNYSESLNDLAPDGSPIFSYTNTNVLDLSRTGSTATSRLTSAQGSRRESHVNSRPDSHRNSVGISINIERADETIQPEMLQIPELSTIRRLSVVQWNIEMSKSDVFQENDPAIWPPLNLTSLTETSRTLVAVDRKQKASFVSSVRFWPCDYKPKE
jgi:hypothetical protein